MSQIGTVEISKALQATIFVQMNAGYPNEAGGFLVGKREGDTVTVLDVIEVENVFETEEQYHRYAMTPQNWAKMEDEADEQGLVLVGYYHSHPDHPAIPSEYDRVHALPNFVYIITSVQDGESVDQKAWLLADDRSAFDALTLSVTAEVAS
ncbi:MAG: M67 family metallopeptidase [Chloroflexota bacterium]